MGDSRRVSADTPNLTGVWHTDDGTPMGSSHRTEAPRLALGNDRSGARLCENAQEPTRRRIIFSIASFPIAATELFFFGMMKSRKTFYV